MKLSITGNLGDDLAGIPASVQLGTPAILTLATPPCLTHGGVSADFAVKKPFFSGTDAILAESTKSSPSYLSPFQFALEKPALQEMALKGCFSANASRRCQ